ncbi:putative Lunapark domain-containing protein [Helianthus annuus]|nr:putative Lunapark domain-containing protein [Helianthus annuus]
MADEKEEKKNKKSKSKKWGFFSRIWNALFGLRGDDFEKRLQYISKEEATLISRMKRRSFRWRTTARNLIIFSLLLEMVAVGYAIMTTRTVDMDWRTRSLRVLPMFLLPALSFGLYYGLSSFTKFCDRRDQKTLDGLREERQAKIDELKERTNYYITQQLIQKYDSDPAAKAAAATVLASKLGADAGLKVFLGDERQPDAHSTGKSSDVDLQQTSGLRKRNQTNPKSPGSNPGHHVGKETPQFGGNEVPGNSPRGPLVVEHHNPAASGAQDGGWIARIAALLVGEDPTQSYALICGNCHMHNGLARKEEFPFITYYCPHCHALNKPKSSVLPSDKMSPVTESPNVAGADVKLTEQSNESTGEKVSAASSPMVAAVEEKEANEKIVD